MFIFNVLFAENNFVGGRMRCHIPFLHFPLANSDRPTGLENSGILENC